MSLLNKKRNSLKHPDQRVGVFIDVQNMYYSAKNLFGAKVNFGNIVKEATAGRKLIRAIAYVVSTESKEEQPFFDALYNVGIETKDKPLQIFLGGEKKADWDVGLAVDAIRFSPSLDAIVLISGDGDYVPLVDYLRAQGKQVEVMAFGDTTSGKLIEAADDFVDLGQEKAKFLIADHRHSGVPTQAVGKRYVVPKKVFPPKPNLPVKPNLPAKQNMPFKPNLPPKRIV